MGGEAADEELGLAPAPSESSNLQNYLGACNVAELQLILSSRTGFTPQVEKV